MNGELARGARAIRWGMVIAGWLASALLGVIIALWSRHSGSWDEGLGWERALLLRLHTRLPRLLDDAVLLIPWSGTNWSLLPISFVASWRATRAMRGDIAVHLLAVTVGSVALNAVLKEIFDRPRPELWEHRGQYAQSSFPSGHMIASISVLLTYALLLHRERGWRWPYAAVALFTITSLYSRLYLGVHWPIDVVAGIASGALWLIASWNSFARPG